jgi:hypothetical protein
MVRLLRTHGVGPAPGLLVLAATSGSTPLGLVADLRTEGLVDRRRLGGLSVDEVAALLGALGSESTPAAAIHRASGGNPALIEQLIGATEAHWHLDRLLDQVGPPTMTTLSAAAATSVGGPADGGFELDHLVVWTGADPGTLIDHLEDAAAAGLVVEDDVDRWAFAHGAVADRLAGAAPT